MAFFLVASYYRNCSDRPPGFNLHQKSLRHFATIGFFLSCDIYTRVLPSHIVEHSHSTQNNVSLRQNITVEGGKDDFQIQSIKPYKGESAPTLLTEIADNRLCH